MNSKLKICFVTGSRAEYGLLQPLMNLVSGDDEFIFQLIATGMHLSPEFGLTYKQIEADGFFINEKVEMLLSGDSDTAITKSTGLGLIGMADAFQRLDPDWIILLGDRFETFAAAIAAHLAKIPIAHLHGGELTEGATDDALRHSISKLSFLHFASTEEYRARIIQLGEHPERVYNVGAIGLDAISKIELIDREQLGDFVKLDLSKPTILVTYHPVTLDHHSARNQIESILNAINRCRDLQVIFTLPNADANGRVIIEKINTFVSNHPENARVFTSLGSRRYYSLLQFVVAVVGNSSSGIIEVPEFDIPTINIGDRQKGRVKASSVIDVDADEEKVYSLLESITLDKFKHHFLKKDNPYHNDGTSSLIVKFIKKWGRISSIKKAFYDQKSTI